jgi:hypothetical protein
MQLDSTLRAALLDEGEAIVADPVTALPRIRARSRAIGRRRSAAALATACAMAAVAWSVSLPASESRDDVVVPPAEQRRKIDERHEGQRLREVSPSRGRGSAPERAPAGTRRSRHAELPVTRGARDRTGKPPASPAPAEDAPPVVPARHLSERYDVAYVAGTHVGENAGTGCGQGESVMRSNDCIPITIGDDESSIELSLVDDRGVAVGATVYHHAGG